MLFTTDAPQTTSRTYSLLTHAFDEQIMEFMFLFTKRRFVEYVYTDWLILFLFFKTTNENNSNITVMEFGIDVRNSQLATGLSRLFNGFFPTHPVYL